MPRTTKRKLKYSSDSDTDAPTTKKGSESNEGGEERGNVGGRSHTRTLVTQSGAAADRPPPSDSETDALSTKKVGKRNEGGVDGGNVGGRPHTRTRVTQPSALPPPPSPPPPQSQPSSTSDIGRRKGGVKKGKGKYVPVKQPAAPAD